MCSCWFYERKWNPSISINYKLLVILYPPSRSLHYDNQRRKKVSSLCNNEAHEVLLVFLRLYWKLPVFLFANWCTSTLMQFVLMSLLIIASLQSLGTTKSQLTQTQLFHRFLWNISNHSSCQSFCRYCKKNQVDQSCITKGIDNDDKSIASLE